MRAGGGPTMKGPRPRRSGTPRRKDLPCGAREVLSSWRAAPPWSRPLLLAFAAPASSPAATGANGRIFFGSNRDGNDEVYSAAVDGSDARNLTQNAAADFSPAVSPDGSRVAFVSDRSGRRSLWLMNADGSGQTQLTDGFYLAPDDEPSWSPDGTQLAFASTRPFN